MVIDQPGVILLFAPLVMGGFIGAVALMVGMISSPPRPARWVVSRPGARPHWDPGRTWSDLLLRSMLIGLAGMFFLLPGLLLLGLASGSRTAARMR